jgi:hypothetical protein
MKVSFVTLKTGKHKLTFPIISSSPSGEETGKAQGNDQKAVDFKGESKSRK